MAIYKTYLLDCATKSCKSYIILFILLPCLASVHCVLLGQLLYSCSLCIAETTPIFMFIVYCWHNSYIHVYCVLLGELLSSCPLCIAETTPIFMFIVYCWDNSYLHVHCVLLDELLSSCLLCIAWTNSRCWSAESSSLALYL